MAALNVAIMGALVLLIVSPRERVQVVVPGIDDLVMVGFEPCNLHSRCQPGLCFSIGKTHMNNRVLPESIAATAFLGNPS
jgi:hypothetical protein